MKTPTSTGRMPARNPVPDAEALAAAALAFLADRPERLSTFLAATGLGPATLRHAAAEPGFARGLLSHLAEDEALLTEFAADQRLPIDRLAAAIARFCGPRDWDSI